MIQPVLNADHAEAALAEALDRCRHRLFIATADVKNVHLPTGRRSRSIIDLFEKLSERGIRISLLHSGAAIFGISTAAYAQPSSAVRGGAGLLQAGRCTGSSPTSGLKERLGGRPGVVEKRRERMKSCRRW